MRDVGRTKAMNDVLIKVSASTEDDVCDEPVVFVFMESESLWGCATVGARLNRGDVNRLICDLTLARRAAVEGRKENRQDDRTGADEGSSDVDRLMFSHHAWPEGRAVPGTWHGGRLPDGRRTASIGCPVCMKIVSLSRHVVDAHGDVSPSVVCPRGCGFHRWVSLQGWG